MVQEVALGSTSGDAAGATAAVASSPWAAFDRVYCISLTTRPDRTAAARRQFELAGVLDRVEFVMVAKHPTNSEQGIFDSHQMCLRKGLADGAATILIFEDDVVFDTALAGRIRDVASFISGCGDWQLLFLGCFNFESKPTSWRSVNRVKYKCATHAYVASRSYAEYLADLTWDGRAYDDRLRAMESQRFFVAYPAVAFQSDLSTDNDALRNIYWLRRLIGGMRRLQKLNETVCRHRCVVYSAMAVGTVIGIAVVAGITHLVRLMLSR